jgi:transcriptional regulator with XRE-family HTH domain
MFSTLFCVENVQPNLGVRLRKLRLDKNLNQDELAELCELSADQISNIERGKSWTGAVSLALLADALGVPQSALFDFSENEVFVREGGLKRRPQRKSGKVSVDRNRKVRIQLPRKRQ